MKNVVAPVGDRFVDFRNLVRRKYSGTNRTILEALFQKIADRYAEYDSQEIKTGKGFNCTEDGK